MELILTICKFVFAIVFIVAALPFIIITVVSGTIMRLFIDVAVDILNWGGDTEE